MSNKDNNHQDNPEDSFPTVSLPGTGTGDTFKMTQIGPYKLIKMLGDLVQGGGYVWWWGYRAENR